MPIVNFHLLRGATDADQDARLLQEATRLYCDVLGAPVDRVRAVITPHAAGQFAVAGVLCSQAAVQAPFFEFIVLEGRPLEQRQRLLRGFTDLLVDVTGVPRERVRGLCIRVDPEDWGIGGEPANQLRAGEIQRRREGA